MYFQNLIMTSASIMSIVACARVRTRNRALDLAIGIVKTKLQHVHLHAPALQCGAGQCLRILHRDASPRQRVQWRTCQPH